ncbi:helix-turn-helix transcriptional regulator, partial [Agrobacterium tumefaciens]|uniref:helix-turn-helix transcriptional regulator n=1 Tax=Agrobacterium tumefaciens TaxID=358 RepID=UPI001F40E280
TNMIVLEFDHMAAAFKKRAVKLVLSDHHYWGGLDNSTLLVGPGQGLAAIHVDLAAIRDTIRKESKVVITYRDEKGDVTERVIWPFALAFFDLVRVVLGWCETRQDYRSFRADRIEDFRPLDSRYPRRRQALLKEWREREKQRRRHHADKN